MAEARWDEAIWGLDIEKIGQGFGDKHQASSIVVNKVSSVADVGEIFPW
jgi:hypothetical protein